MQKLSGNSSSKNNKCCSVFHHESYKIGFAFFWIFYDFLWILQESTKWLYYLRCGFADRPLEKLWFSQIYPRFAFKTLERLQTLQCHPSGRWRRGRRNSGEAGGLGQAGAGAEWSWGSLGPVWGFGWSGSAAGDGVKRRRPAAAAWSSAPVRWLPGGKSERVSEH
jgi:hypothetical protein